MKQIPQEIEIIKQLGQTLQDGLIIYGMDAKEIVYANEPGTTMLEISEGDGAEQILNAWRKVLIQDRAYLSAQLTLLTQDGTSKSAEFGIAAGDHSRKYYHVTGCLIQQKTLLILFLRDITHSKQHEDYLVEFGVKKNTLLDTLTHNLSGSLSLTRNLAAQAFRHTDSATDELKTLIGLMRENNEGSLKIVEDFLLFEHQKSPRIQIKTSRIDVVEKVGFIYEQLQYSYPGRRFEFITDRDELHITTDEVKLLQVMNNLVANAIKFSPEASVIRLSIAADAEFVNIAVIDQGIGIPDQLKPLIFLPQSQTGRAGLQGERSHGKGLMICKHLIELLNGNIWFKSTELKGSTFYVQLPYFLS